MDWIKIRSFGKVKYFNLSYVVLIGMPLLAEVYDYVHQLLAKMSIAIPLLDGFPLTFKLLYLSSLLYAIGMALYQFFCPPLIKNFESDLAYVRASQEIYERSHPDKKFHIVLANLTDSQADVRQKLIAEKANHDKVLGDSTSTTKDKNDALEKLYGMLNGLYPSCVQRFLVCEFLAEKNKYPAAIYISGCCFLGGTGLMLFLLFRKSARLFLA